MIRKINPENRQIYISIVSIGELRSIALQNNWGRRKLDAVEPTIEESVIVEVNENLVEPYSQIDSYSQIRNRNFFNYPFGTPRNMGKNDLWIASTAAILSLKLVTTNGDFDHLHKIFFELQKIIYDNI